MVIHPNRPHRLWIALAALSGLAALAASGDGWAQSGCEATSANYDQRCSITCKPGDVAACRDSPGSSSPDCFCTASVDPRQPDVVSSALQQRRSTPPAAKPSNPSDRGTQKSY